MIKALLFGSIFVLGAAPVFAQTKTVDQSNVLPMSASGVTSVSQGTDVFSAFGQSFTPTFSGIDFATFLFQNNAPTTTRIPGGTPVNGPSAPATYTASLYSGFGTYTTSNLLGTSGVSLVPVGNNLDIEFDFASRIALTPGQTYTLILTDLAHAADPNFEGSGSVTEFSGYAGGQAVSESSTDLVFSEGIFSAAAPAVPEPASWAMTILGVGAIGTVLRRGIRVSNRRFDAKIRRIEAGDAA